MIPKVEKLSPGSRRVTFAECIVDILWEFGYCVTYYPGGGIVKSGAFDEQTAWDYGYSKDATKFFGIEHDLIHHFVCDTLQQRSFNHWALAHSIVQNDTMKKRVELEEALVAGFTFLVQKPLLPLVHTEKSWTRTPEVWMTYTRSQFEVADCDTDAAVKACREFLGSVHFDT